MMAKKIEGTDSVEDEIKEAFRVFDNESQVGQLSHFKLLRNKLKSYFSPKALLMRGAILCEETFYGMHAQFLTKIFFFKNTLKT